MPRLGTIASLTGIVAGGWNVFAYLGACHSLCLARSTAPSDALGVVYAGLAVVLVLVSLAGLIGPKVLFYASALVAVLVDAVEAVGNAEVATGVLVFSFALVTLSAVVSLLAARAGTGVSEQSNPMNLPVFG